MHGPSRLSSSASMSPAAVLGVNGKKEALPQAAKPIPSKKPEQCHAWATRLASTSLCRAGAGTPRHDTHGAARHGARHATPHAATQAEQHSRHQRNNDLKHTVAAEHRFRGRAPVGRRVAQVRPRPSEAAPSNRPGDRSLRHKTGSRESGAS